MSFKVAIYEKASDDPNNPSFNAMRFDTEQNAKSYLFDLGMRWLAFDHGAVVPSDDPANYTYDRAPREGGGETITLRSLEVSA